MNHAQYNWEIEQRMLYTTNNSGIVEEVDDYKALVRSDNDKMLGVVGQNYAPMLNATFADIVNTLEDKTSCTLRTYGEQADGKKLYAKLTHPSMQDFQMNAIGDEVASSIVIANGHAGALAFRMYIEYMRLICLNGLTIPVRKNFVYARHTKNYMEKIGDLTDNISSVVEAYDNNKETLKRLDRKFVTGFSPREWFADFFKYYKKPRPIKRDGKIIQWTPPDYSTKAINNMNALELCYADSGAVGTYWGMLNAVTYFIDHMQSNKPNGYESLGHGNDVKVRAFQDLSRIAQA